MLDADKTDTDSDKMAVKEHEPTVEAAQPQTVRAKNPNHGKYIIFIFFELSESRDFYKVPHTIYFQNNKKTVWFLDAFLHVS